MATVLSRKPRANRIHHLSLHQATKLSTHGAQSWFKPLIVNSQRCLHPAIEADLRKGNSCLRAPSEGVLYFAGAGTKLQHGKHDQSSKVIVVFIIITNTS
jgi:hypothetical protein